MRILAVGLLSQKLLILKLLLLCFLFFSFGVRAQEAEVGSRLTQYEMLELLEEVMQKVKDEYVDEVDERELVEAAIRGMLASLDPHSSYLDIESLGDLRTRTKGKFGGLGIEIQLDKSGYVLIVSPIDDTPAARAGLQAGDLITAIDDKVVLGMTLSEAVGLMRGDPGTDITLEILRGDDDVFDVIITRAIIKVQSVRWRILDKDIGYIRITDFSGQTQAGLEEAVRELKSEQDDSPNGYILDLRNNPGGLLDQAVSVSDSFLERGEIVSTRGREADKNYRFQAKRGDLIDSAPLFVLINAGSASASEIVAGALQDHRRALLLGSKSFGKGSVQTILPLLDTKVALKLTTQRYYTPSGTSIQAKGITPDIAIEPAKIVAIEQGRRRFEANLPSALDNHSQEESEEQDGKLNSTSANEDGNDESSDYVLDRAVELMRTVILYGNLNG